MEEKYRVAGNRILPVFLFILLIGVGIKASLQQPNPLQGKIMKPAGPPPHSVCNDLALWSVMKKQAIAEKRFLAEKFFVLKEAGQDTIWGTVKKYDRLNGVDHQHGPDADSTFNIIVDNADRIKIQNYIKYPQVQVFINDKRKELKKPEFTMVATEIHCEIVYTDPTSKDSTYKMCKCQRPKMPAEGDRVQVTGKLIIDKRHVDNFPFFELHPVTYIWNDTRKR